MKVLLSRTNLQNNDYSSRMLNLGLSEKLREIHHDCEHDSWEYVDLGKLST